MFWIAEHQRQDKMEVPKHGPRHTVQQLGPGHVCYKVSCYEVDFPDELLISHSHPHLARPFISMPLLDCCFLEVE